jgi:hypothetical protein
MRRYLAGASTLALMLAVSPQAVSAQDLENFEAGVTGSNAYTLFDSLGEDAFGDNILNQDVANNDVKGRDLVEGDGSRYNADVNFGESTYQDQKVNINGIGSGLNTAQQGGIAFAADNVGESASGAIALNTARQNATNRVGTSGDTLDSIARDGGVFDARPSFGQNTFKDQKVNVNGLNSGINAGQQGLIAVGANLSNEQTLGDGKAENLVATAKSGADVKVGVGKNTKFTQDGLGVNVAGQKVTNRITAEKVPRDGEALIDGSDTKYQAKIDLTGGPETPNKAFRNQNVNVNGVNTGLNAGQQGLIALGADKAPDDGGQGVNAGGQSATNSLSIADVEETDPSNSGLLSEGTYDGRTVFGAETFKAQKINVNGLNTGINAGQQGGLAVGASTRDNPENAANEPTVNYDASAGGSDGADLTDIGYDMDGAGVNVLQQTTNNSVDLGAGGNAIDAGNYRANVTFGSQTFQNQKINSNGINTGINASQQGAVALGFDRVTDTGAVAVNVLDQVASNSFTMAQSGSDLVSGGGTYNASVTFGSDTFKNQVGNVNAVNTGINAAQQGAIAISVSGGSGSSTSVPR